METFEPLPIRGVKAPQNLPPEPVVLITGGLGHMGLSLGEALFGRSARKVGSGGPDGLPEPGQWAAESQDPVTSVRKKRCSNDGRMRTSATSAGINGGFK